MPCSFWPRQTGSSSRTSCRAVPRPSTLPWPKMANTPANSGARVPSSSSVRCARIQRTSACEAVSRTRPTRLARSVRSGAVVSPMVMRGLPEVDGLTGPYRGGTSHVRTARRVPDAARGGGHRAARVGRHVVPLPPYPRVGGVVAERHRTPLARPGQHVEVVHRVAGSGDARPVLAVRDEHHVAVTHLQRLVQLRQAGLRVLRAGVGAVDAEAVAARGHLVAACDAVVVDL